MSAAMTYELARGPILCARGLANAVFEGLEGRLREDAAQKGWVIVETERILLLDWPVPGTTYVAPAACSLRAYVEIKEACNDRE